MKFYRCDNCGDESFIPECTLTGPDKFFGEVFLGVV